MSPGLSIIAGNGQVTLQFFNTTVPLTIEARDASGRPMPNLPLNWAVTQGFGTVVNPPVRTDSNGQASAYFNGNVVPGYSFTQHTVNVSSSTGSVNFIVTTVINRLPSGTVAELPLVQLTAPPAEDRSLTARAGSTITGALQIIVAVQSGSQTGTAISNIGMRVANSEDPNATPVAHCAGEPVTDNQGIGSCDLVVTGPPGTYLISLDVGEFRITPGVYLTILGGSCTYTVTASSLQFGPAASIGTLNVSTLSGCTWTATSNASWINITSGGSGSSTGGVAFSILANSGSTRTGSILVGNQTTTITQLGAGSSPGPALAVITLAALPSGVVGSPYTASLAASGGRAPYNWLSPVVLPSGLTLNPATGSITGTPAVAGSYSLPITVTDQDGSAQSRTFMLSVVSAGTGSGTNPVVTNASFPGAAAGSQYRQRLTSAGGCASPFSAPPTYNVTAGALPTGLAVAPLDDRNYAITGVPTTPGTFNFTLTVTDPCGRSGSANFTITITGTGIPSAEIIASPTSLTFSASEGTFVNPADQSISLSGPAGGTFSATATTSSGGAWLSLSGASAGTFPGAITVHVAIVPGLVAGSYSGAITVTSVAGNVTIPVTLSVSPTSSSGLTTIPASINATVEVGSTSVQQKLTVRNPSAVTVFRALVTTVNGGSWLSLNFTEAATAVDLVVTLNPAGLQPALYTGSIQLLPTNPAGTPITVPVTLRVLPPGGLAVSPGILSFTSQIGQSGPSSQQVQVASTGLPVDASVTASTISGGSWLQATPARASTTFTAVVAVNPAGLAAGFYQGTVTIASLTAGITPINIPVSLTVSEGAPVITAITNAATFQTGPVSPGEIVTVFGTGIGPVTLVGSHVTAGVLDSLVADTKVYFDDVPAPLLYSSRQQVSAIVPYSVAGKAITRVELEYRGVRSSPLNVDVAAARPGIFTFASSGQGPAAALNEDGSINSAANGAAPGTIVVLYLTGEGQTNPGGVDGKLAIGTFPKPVLPVTVKIGGQDADVLYAGAAPELAAGLMQVNVRMSKAVARGVPAAVEIQVGGVPAQTGVTVFMKP